MVLRDMDWMLIDDGMNNTLDEMNFIYSNFYILCLYVE